MKKILITNDDGINADGLIRLVKAAREFGEVWVVAPESQRSAASHSITLHKPIDVYPYELKLEEHHQIDQLDFGRAEDGELKDPDSPKAEGCSHDFVGSMASTVCEQSEKGKVHAFSCSGTPADCVRVGSLNIMPEKPDVVLSGINYGYNACSDIQYSATAGAAFEGTFQGCLSIALSEGADSCHEVTDAYLRKVLSILMEKEPVKGQIYNVNFPQCKLSECKGILWDRPVSEGMFFKDRYNKVEDLEDGGIRLMVEGIYNEDAEEGTDFRAIVDGYVSVGVVNNIGYGV